MKTLSFWAQRHAWAQHGAWTLGFVATLSGCVGHQTFDDGSNELKPKPSAEHEAGAPPPTTPTPESSDSESEVGVNDAGTALSSSDGGSLGAASNELDSSTAPPLETTAASALEATDPVSSGVEEVDSGVVLGEEGQIIVGEGEQYLSVHVAREFDEYSWNEELVLQEGAHAVLTVRRYDGEDTGAPLVLERHVPFANLPLDFEVRGDLEALRAEGAELLVSVYVYNHVGDGLVVGDLYSEYRNLTEALPAEVEVVVSGMEWCGSPEGGGGCAEVRPRWLLEAPELLVAGRVERVFGAEHWNESLVPSADAHAVVSVRPYLGENRFGPTLGEIDVPFAALPFDFEVVGQADSDLVPGPDSGAVEWLVSATVFNHAGFSPKVGDLRGDADVHVAPYSEDMVIEVGGLESCDDETSGGVCISPPGPIEF